MGNLAILLMLTYFVLVVLVGVVLRKYAAKNLDAYFLGGRNMHWSLLAMSGAVSNFDLTGTMFICSLLYLLGLKSMWAHMMWGILMGAFFMSFIGKWVRRSQVVTAAEWMLTRFGNEAAGRTARLMYALMAITTLAGFIGYAFQGIGKFAAVYLPYSPTTCALVVVSITTAYCLLGGISAVIVGDILQSLILLVCSLSLSYLAWTSVDLATLPQLLPNYEDWASIVPTWNTTVPGFEMFGMLAIAWTLKGLLLNFGGPGQMYDFQRFLAAKTPLDAAKLGAAWSLFLIVRWPLCISVALLAITQLPPGTITDAEQVMPVVFKEVLSPPMRSLAIIGFVAAFMSCFSATINSGASYLVKDIWQEYFRPHATDKELIRASYLATVGIVVGGVLTGIAAESIRQIWDWIMMALGTGVIIPNVLRWYWWRLNGWGYSAGVGLGLLGSTAFFLAPDMPIYVQFALIAGVSTLGSVIVSLMTAPTPAQTLTAFYESVRPFGAWGPIARTARSTLAQEQQPIETLSFALGNTVLGCIAITGCYIAPMYVVGHWYGKALGFALAGLSAIACLYVTWYLPLRRAEQKRSQKPLGSPELSPHHR